MVSKTPSVWLHGRTLARDYRYRQSKSSMVALANWTTMFQSSNHYSRQNTFHDPYRLSSHWASFTFHGFLRLHWRNSSTILHRKTVSSNYVHLTLIGIGWPTHYLNVMDSVIILKMGWTSPIGQIFISAMGFLWTRSAVLTFCMPVFVHLSFGKMTCFGYGHFFPRAFLPSSLWDPDWL